MTPNYSDLICECAELDARAERVRRVGSVEIRETEISDSQAPLLGRRAGRYVTIEPQTEAETRAVRGALIAALRRLSDRSVRSVLVTGLGNRRYTVDALGAAVTEQIRAQEGKLAIFTPGIAQITGISSFDAVRGISRAVRPDLIVAVDTLVTDRPARLGRCYQLTTAGIRPGSGVDNANPTLCERTLGIPLLAIGVPLATYLIDKRERLLVTPAEIDDYVRDTSGIIAAAVNRVFG